MQLSFGKLQLPALTAFLPHNSAVVSSPKESTTYAFGWILK